MVEPKMHNGVSNGDHELGNQTTLTNQGGSPIGRQISVTLSKLGGPDCYDMMAGFARHIRTELRGLLAALAPEQFEQLYLQPGGVGGKGDLSKRFANPTPL